MEFYLCEWVESESRNGNNQSDCGTLSKCCLICHLILWEGFVLDVGFSVYVPIFRAGALFSLPSCTRFTLTFSLFYLHENSSNPYSSVEIEGGIASSFKAAVGHLLSRPVQFECVTLRVLLLVMRFK